MPSKENQPPDPEKKPQGKPPVPTKEPEGKPAPTPEKPKKKPEPKVKKDETLKYEFTYANGGFNNGVELKPGKNGKIELDISIYGGGEKKTMGISGYPAEIQKLIQAYEVGATSGQETEDITKALKGYFQRVNQTLSMKIISILENADNQIKNAIKQTFKEVK